ARIGRFAAAHEPKRHAIAAGGAKSGGQPRVKQRTNQHASAGRRLKSVS
ncbi:alpha/beta hydrolase, partial [Burkholderia pseudomallei]|nr:alpha/beta hydrolase [Burkholderia pseudomallei]